MRRRVLTTLTLLPLLFLTNCGESPPGGKKPSGASPAVRDGEAPPNVLLISIDMLRPDHLSAYGYPRKTSPRMDQVASEGAVFENAISSTSWTLPAHAALFTGLADSIHGCTDTDQRLHPSRTTIAERFSDAGYATAGFFSGPFLHPIFGLAQGFDVYTDCTSYADRSQNTAEKGDNLDTPTFWNAAHDDITSPRVYERVSDWLNDNYGTDPGNDNSESEDRTPFFLFVHLWDVHFDFLPPPPFDTMFDPNYTGTITGKNFYFDELVSASMPQRDLEHLLALYDGEIAWTDMHVGKILDDLDGLGLTDSTIVVIVSDHGTEFFEHRKKGHRHTLYDECIRIVTMMRYPGHIEPGLRFDEQTHITDIAPTLLALAGREVPPQIMGRSLVPLLAGFPSPHELPALSELFSMGNEARSFRRPDLKLISDERDPASIDWKSMGGPFLGQRLFDLKKDPGELKPLAPDDQKFAAMKDQEARTRLLIETFSKILPAGFYPLSDIPEDLLRQLESFGYVGGAEEESDTENSGAAEGEGGE